MRARTIIPLIIGLGVGFFAIKLGLDMVQKAKGAQGEEVTVLVSAKQIDVASRITESMLTVKKVPQSLVPQDAFTASKDLIGRVTAMNVVTGVPITKTMLAPPGSEPGLQAIIPPGMRAASVSVNEESSVAGFIMPGSRVDVSAAPQGNAGPARIILSNVEVGAVGQSMNRVADDGKTVRMEKSVTLFLHPEEVQILHAFVGNGRIRLALRGATKDPGESPFAKMIRTAMAPKPAAEPRLTKKKAPTYHVVSLVRGQDSQRLIFDSAGNMRRVSADAPLPSDLANAGLGDMTSPPKPAPPREITE